MVVTMNAKEYAAKVKSYVGVEVVISDGKIGHILGVSPTFNTSWIVAVEGSDGFKVEQIHDERLLVAATKEHLDWLP